MNNNLYKLKFNIIKVKNKKINEDIGIFRTTGTVNGYFLVLSSDLRGDQGIKETAIMGKILNLTKGSVFNLNFQKPEYFKDYQTGQFGWGYYLPMNASNEKTNEILNNLRSLKKEYYKAKKIDKEEDTKDLSLNDIKELRSVVNNVAELTDAIRSAAENTEDSAMQQRLDKYFEDLQNAIEDDNVFLFLIDNYEKAKTFQKKNSAWKYSLLNSLIITIADPTAFLAGPQKYWIEKGFRIKKEFYKNGIEISKPKTDIQKGKTSDVDEKVAWAKQNPNVIRDFLIDQGYDPNESIEGKDYQLAKFISQNKLYGKFAGSFNSAMVYTNNMVEEVPGKAEFDLNSPDENDYTKLEKSFQGNLTPLYNAVLRVCQSENVFIPDNLKRNTNNLGDFNKIVTALVKKRLVEKFGGEAKVKPEFREQLEVRTAAIVQIIMDQFGISSEAAKFNLAAIGADRQALERSRGVIMANADALIDKIDVELNKNIQENRIRKIIYKLIRENY